MNRELKEELGRLSLHGAPREKKIQALALALSAMGDEKEGIVIRHEGQGLRIRSEVPLRPGEFVHFMEAFEFERGEQDEYQDEE